MYPVLLAILSAMLFGASTPVGKVLLASLPPFQLAGCLYLGAALGLVPAVFFTPDGAKAFAPMDKLNLRRLAGAVGLGGVAGPVLLLMGLQRSSAASVAMWLNLELVATALLGYLVFRDHLGRGGWIGVAGTILASMLLSWQGGAVGLIALLLVAGACICWGADNHLTALIDGITPQQSTFWKGITAGGINLSIGLIVEPYGAKLVTVIAAMVLGAFAYGMSIVLYIKAAQTMGATRSQMIFSSAPFFGAALAVPILGETISMVQAVSALILIVSLVVLFRDQHAHTHVHVPTRHRHDHNHKDAHHDHGHVEDPPSANHEHDHSHGRVQHAHPHWPDIHHRHDH